MIPYAPTVFEGPKAFNVCPVCDVKIELRARKDEESYSGAEYARHVELWHPDKVVRLGPLTWADVLAYCRTHTIVTYKAPLDLRSTQCRVVRVFKNGKVRLRPITSDASTFTADSGHLPRFQLRGF